MYVHDVLMHALHKDLTLTEVPYIHSFKTLYRSNVKSQLCTQTTIK